MSPAGVAFILIILVVTASVFITVSNMNKTVQELNNTVSSISAELNTIKQAVNLTEDYRVLLSILGPIALEKLEKTIVLEDYIIHVIQGVGAGDVLAPHLYDFFFDGVNDYLVVGLQPDGSGNIFTVYGWSGITIVELVNVNDSRTARFSGALGDQWIDRPFTSITRTTAGAQPLQARFTTRLPDGTLKMYNAEVSAYIDMKYGYIARVFSISTRTYEVYANGSKIYSATIPSTEYTILEWNPATATYPRRYQRFVLGANSELAEHLSLYQSYLLIYSRVLSDVEIQTIYNAKVVNASALEILIDPTFTDGTNYFNMGRHNATVRAYNGVSRVKANETWIWILRNATSDAGVWLRFFPSGTLIVYRTGEIEKITSTEYYTNRTDIMLVMIPRGAIK